MKKSFFTLFLLAVCTVGAMAQCPTPSSVNASVTFKRHIPGTIDGDFSVAAGRKVRFAEGNLQYNSATQAWQFAAHQYDYIGDNTGNTSITMDGKANNTGVADLFGWVGASSTWTGLKQYGMTSVNTIDGYGNVATENLKSDWGTLKGFGWRTLTSAEWNYLLNTRSASTVAEVANRRFTKATINIEGTAVQGIILFPDGGTFAAGEFTAVGSPNNTSADYTTRCTSAQWNALEDKGCVFLPAAGNRNGATVSAAGSSGCYWSSSPNTSNVNYAYIVLFDGSNFNPAGNSNRFNGRSVRLVCNVQ